MFSDVNPPLLNIAGLKVESVHCSSRITAYLHRSARCLRYDTILVTDLDGKTSWTTTEPNSTIKTFPLLDLQYQKTKSIWDLQEKLHLVQKKDDKRMNKKMVDKFRFSCPLRVHEELTMIKFKQRILSNPLRFSWQRIFSVLIGLEITEQALLRYLRCCGFSFLHLLQTPRRYKHCVTDQ